MILAPITPKRDLDVVLFFSRPLRKKGWEPLIQVWDRIVQLKIVISKWTCCCPVLFIITHRRDLCENVNTICRLFIIIIYLLFMAPTNLKLRQRGLKSGGLHTNDVTYWGSHTRRRAYNELFHNLLSLLTWKGEINY